MKYQRVELLKLVASEQPRPLITADVDKLASSIREVGLIQPITVKARAVMSGGLSTQGFQIVAGHHRVAACRSLGWTEIDAIVIDAAGHLEAELVEIDENLCRSELSASQRSHYTKRRKQIWEALHPVQKEERQRVADLPEQAGQVAPPVAKHGRQQEKAFAASTAAITGEDKRTINRHIARAEALGDDLPRVQGTSLDKGVELDALAKLPQPERVALIERAEAGECVSARDTSSQKKTPKDVPLTPSMRLQIALVHGIERMLESSGTANVEALVASILALPLRERDFLADQLDALEFVALLGSSGRRAA